MNGGSLCSSCGTPNKNSDFTGVDQNIILNIISSLDKSLQTFDLMLLGKLIFAFVNVDNKLVEVVLVVDEYCRLKCSPVYRD